MFPSAAADGWLHFAGRNAAAEQLAVRRILARKQGANERLHELHMALLGETRNPTRRSGTRDVVHTVRDESIAGEPVFRGESQGR